MVVSASVCCGKLLLPITVVFIYIMQRIYLPSQHRLRELENEAKSSVQIHFKATQAGLGHIRGLEQQGTAANEMFRLIDCVSKIQYQANQIFTRLRLVCDIYNGLIGILVVSSALALSGTTFPGMLALALLIVTDSSNVISCGLIDGMDRLGQCLASVSHIRNFLQCTPQEEDEIASTPLNMAPGQWPLAGGLSFENTTIIQRLVSSY